MRVAVDARQMFRPHRRGIGKTLTDLYQTLADRRPGWRFVLVHQTPGSAPDVAGRPNVSRSRLDFPGADRSGLWEQAYLPAAALAARADVLHAPANGGPRWSRVPVVVTVHDLIPVDDDPADPANRAWAGRVRAAARAARHVLTPSEYSKGRIVSVLGVPAGKVTVTGWAPDRAVRRVDDPAAVDRVRQKHGLRAGEPYVFGFGAADPRKNTARVIEAYAGLPAGVRGAFRLLLVGVQGPALAGFVELAHRLGVGDRVTLRGFSDEGDLPALLTGAAALCFPSRSEGFGLPVLDAFACGTPVLTGDRTSLPEVAGGAALLVDPDRTDAIRDGLQRLLTDEALRRDLAARGTDRVKSFTWDGVADTVARVFEAAAR